MKKALFLMVFTHLALGVGTPCTHRKKNLRRIRCLPSRFMEEAQAGRTFTIHKHDGTRIRVKPFVDNRCCFIPRNASLDKNVRMTFVPETLLQKFYRRYPDYENRDRYDKITVGKCAIGRVVAASIVL